MSRKECVFSIDRNGTNGALDGVVIHFNAAVGEEQVQAIPVVGDIFERFAKRGFCRDTGAVVGKLNLKLSYQRFGTLLARSSTRGRVLATDMCFNLI